MPLPLAFPDLCGCPVWTTRASTSFDKSVEVVVGARAVESKPSRPTSKWTLPHEIWRRNEGDGGRRSENLPTLPVHIVMTSRAKHDAVS